MVYKYIFCAGNFQMNIELKYNIRRDKSVTRLL